METPVFTVTPKSLDLVAKIAEMVGELHGSGEYARDLHLRKVNRIRSIHSFLAIEANSLSVEQVADIINGKRVLGKPNEIQEVKNAYEAYEHLLEYNPYSAEDLLKAHKYMTDKLIDSAGRYRGKGVGVYAGKTLIHAGAHQDFVSKLITDLLNWAKGSGIHPLIKSAIVHFEIEFIHPFADGNGRIGRLWQTLILSGWNEIFAWIPIETVVYESQQGYYGALGVSERFADRGVFIEFMLGAIYQALSELPIHKTTDTFTNIDTDKLTKTELEFLDQIAGFIEKNGEITNYRAQLLTNKTAVSVNKYLVKFVELGLLTAIGENKGRRYIVKKPMSVTP
ncbi:MAG: Fic family protein [Candidatus Nomurabacteria bacterium]|jgi:Fic family protein|nr:Fic family protein [Candidatus Nomurabacteria bacterium]